jgi:hypothetical protein
MANVIPWGSRNTEAFVKRLGKRIGRCWNARWSSLMI